MSLHILIASSAFLLGELIGKILFWLALAIGTTILVFPLKKKGKEKQSPGIKN